MFPAAARAWIVKVGKKHLVGAAFYNSNMCRLEDPLKAPGARSMTRKKSVGFNGKKTARSYIQGWRGFKYVV